MPSHSKSQLQAAHVLLHVMLRLHVRWQQPPPHPELQLAQLRGTQAPLEQRSSGPQLPHCSPPAPHTPSEVPPRQVPVAEQQPSHDSAVHSHAPLTHAWPPAHAAAPPHEHAPARLHWSAVIGSHEVQEPPLAPH